MRPTPERTRRRPVSRRGGRELLAVFVVLGALGAGAWTQREHFFGPAAAGSGAAPEEPPPRWVDPASARVMRTPGWLDPRWEAHLAAVLAERGPLVVGDVAALEDLCAELESLSFVERVRSCELTPFGLDLDVLVRRPVACIPVRGELALVDGQGVVLEGRWPVAPRLGEVVLPVLGIEEDPVLDGARPGDWLADPEHLDALDVALSMEEHLAQDQRAALGRVQIDARRARMASVDEPGVRLALEGGRVALFGRPPRCGEPGELPCSTKWRSLAAAVQLFLEDPQANDWSLVDLRWDRPDLALRTAPSLAALEPESVAPRRAAGREREARTRTGAQVR